MNLLLKMINWMMNLVDTIIEIVIGVICVTLIVIIIVYFLKRKRKPKPSDTIPTFEESEQYVIPEALKVSMINEEDPVWNETNKAIESNEGYDPFQSGFEEDHLLTYNL